MAEVARARKEAEEAVARLDALAEAAASAVEEAMKSADDLAELQRSIKVAYKPYVTKGWKRLCHMDVVEMRHRQRMESAASVILSQEKETIPDEVVQKVLAAKKVMDLFTITSSIAKVSTTLVLLMSMAITNKDGTLPHGWIDAQADEFEFDSDEEFECTGEDVKEGMVQIMRYSRRVLVEVLRLRVDNLEEYNRIFGPLSSPVINKNSQAFQSFVGKLKKTAIYGTRVRKDFNQKHRQFMESAGVDHPQKEVTAYDYFFALGNYIFV